MFDDRFMISVMRDGIGGCHLGGEGATKYTSTVESLKLNIEIFDFLSLTSNIENSIRDGYLKPLVGTVSSVLDILKGVEVIMGTAPRFQILQIEKKIFREVQNMYTLSSEGLIRESYSNFKFNKLFDELSKDEHSYIEYKNVLLKKSSELKRLIKEHEIATTHIVEIEDGRVTILKKNLRLTQLAYNTYDLMFRSNETLKYIKP